MSDLRVSVLELPARWGGAEAALSEVDALLDQGPTDLAVVPEMGFTGYVSTRLDFDLSQFAEPIDGPLVRSVTALTRRRRVHLVAPLVLAEAGALYNACILAGPDGTVLATYRKRHPWLPERWATPGPSEPPVVPVNGVSVTFAICYDGHFLADDAATPLSRADLLVFTSAWVDDEESRLPLLRALARRFHLPIANANWGPGALVVPGQGGSCVLDATGEVIAEVGAGSGPRRADALVPIA